MSDKNTQKGIEAAAAAPHAVFTGAIYMNITSLGESHGIKITAGVKSDELYCAGSAKNEATSTNVVVRLQSSFFDSGYVDITLLPGEVVKFKRLKLDSLYCPGLAGANTPNVSAIAAPYFADYFTLGDPEISIS